MASYYYLIASLPELRADGDMPITYDEFLTCCQSNVSESDYQLLKDLTLNSTEGPLVDEWSKFYGMLNRELNYQRSMNLGKSYSSAFDKDGFIAQVVNSALSAKNPLEAEKQIVTEIGIDDILQPLWIAHIDTNHSKDERLQQDDRKETKHNTGYS